MSDLGQSGADAALGALHASEADMVASPGVRALQEAAGGAPFGTDLVDLLTRRLSSGGSITKEDTAFLTERVHGPEYSSLNLISDLSGFDTRFRRSLVTEAPLSACDARTLESAVGDLLNQIQSLVLKHTAGAYECIVETEWLPICQVDRDGKVEYANGAMRTLCGDRALLGSSLEDCFLAEDRELVRNAIAAGPGDQPVSKRELRFRTANGGFRRVLLNAQPLRSVGCDLGSYVSLFDIEEVIARQEKFLDRLVLSAIKLDTGNIITYANPATNRLLGSDQDLRGVSIFDIFPRTEVVSSQLAKRQAGKAGMYEAQIVRPKDGKQIPVSVAGTPILDDDGRCLGTLGLIRSLERDKAADAIHALMNNAQDEQKLLEDLAREVGKLVPFDSFRVSRLSRDSKHVSMWFAYTPGGALQLNRRWWPISAERRRELEQTVIHTDYSAYLRKTWPEADKDPDLKQFFQEGYESALRIPIWREGRVTATVMLFSKAREAYSQEHLEELQGLPLEQAIQLAISYRNSREAAFRYDLLKEIVNLAHSQEVLELLVSKLAENYDWHHVSVFNVSETEGVFRLMAESSGGHSGTLPPERREQKITAGTLAWVYNTKTHVNIPNVEQGEWAQRVLKVWPDVRSELCVPLIWNGKVHSLLNIEDERENAFSTDEEEALTAIVDEIQVILGRISQQEVLLSAYQSSSDAVFITDMQGNVLSANPAAAKLVGVENQSEACIAFKTFFKDEATYQKTFEWTGTTGREVAIRRTNGQYIPVLISGSQLEESLARKVFVAKDLRLLKRIEKLEGLRKLFEEVAVQTHTPLAMVQTWLLRFQEKGGASADSEWAAKLLAQLKKVEISYDRLALCADADRATALTNRVAVDIESELNSCVTEFPMAEAARVHVKAEQNVPYVTADPAQLSFIFSTIVSYLLRSAGEDPITAEISRTGSAVEVRFAGPGTPEPLPEGKRWLRQVRLDLALGEPAIKSFAKNNNAEYERDSGAESTRFYLCFPALE